MAPAQCCGEGQLRLFVQEMDCEEGQVRQGKLQSAQFSLGRTKKNGGEDWNLTSIHAGYPLSLPSWINCEIEQVTKDGNFS